MSEVVNMQEFARKPKPQPYNPASTIQQLRELIASLTEAKDISSACEAFRLDELIKARASRSQFFNPRLFADPAWDMLLALYSADVAQTRVSVGTLVTAAAVPFTTGLRWLDSLVKEGLASRERDRLDGRRIFVQLTDKGRTAMNNYLQSLPPGLRPL